MSYTVVLLEEHLARRTLIENGHTAQVSSFAFSFGAGL